MSVRFYIPTALTVLLSTIAITGQDESMPTVHDATDQVAETSAASGPRITVRDASPAQITRLGKAFEAFDRAKLELPGIEIRFFTDHESCGAEHGRFYTTGNDWRVHICPTRLDSVIEHELAHAWERANLTDSERRAFMRLRGYEVWSDPDRSWGERGMEGAAFIIQQGLANGLPLPPALGAEVRSRLRAYEQLTGRLAPALVAWLEANDVPCPERPTRMSRSHPDGSGRVCIESLAR